MPDTSEQTLRREAICELLQGGPVANQQSLLDMLQKRDFAATQSSVSRDLKRIGAIKTARGYELPVDDLQTSQAFDSVAEFIRGLRPAGPNLLVIRTAIGAAQRVALALDRSDWPEIVGNIGGDDTVFVATDSALGQRNLVARIDRVLSR